MSMSVDDTQTGQTTGQPVRRTRWSGLRIMALTITVALILAAGVNLVALLMSSTTTTSLTFPVSGPGTSVFVEGGDVDLRGGAVTDIEVTRKVHRGLVEPTYEEVVNADGLHLSSDCPWYASGPCGVSYEIVVPEDLAASIRSGNGDVHVRDLNGDVEVVASSGDVTLANLGGAVSVRSNSGDVSVAGIIGDIAITSSSGDVHATDVQSRNFSADASSGDVSARFAETPATIGVHASSGDVHVTVPDDGTAYAVDEKTSSGDSHVSVATDPGSSHTANLHTSSGDLSFSYG